MAVQAQYPSNVLLLNRSGQDQKNILGTDYILPPQSGGFLDQAQMQNNGVSNPRKRGREVVTAAAAAAAVSGAAAPINLFSVQPQLPPPTLVNLPPLHNPQPNIVSTGLHLAFGDQQRQQQQQQRQQQQRQQQLLLPSSVPSSLLSEDLATQIKQQTEEIDQFLQSQGDQLRRTLAEKRQRHYRSLLVAAEEYASRRIREKEAEIEKASRRNAELEERVAQLRVESQLWQAKARAQEATAVSLHAQLQQAMMGGGAHDKREEGVGCAGGVEGQAEDAESAYVDPERVESAALICKACRKRAVSVVLWPCRHLCLCTECDSVAQSCPLCLSLRTAGIEVFFS